MPVVLAKDSWRVGNLLLSALPPEDRDRLFPHLELVQLAGGQVLYRSTERIAHFYFPVDSAVARVGVDRNGATAEHVLIGKEGLVGLNALLGDLHASADAIVQTGTTLTLQMPKSSSEVHSFTFGPSNGEDGYVDQIATSLLGPVFNPIGVYPSEQPTAISTYLPTLHGNGFWNSGLLDSDSATPLPSRTQVTFGQPGTYSYLCLIHPFMQGKVTVNL